MKPYPLHLWLSLTGLLLVLGGSALWWFDPAHDDALFQLWKLDDGAAAVPTALWLSRIGGLAWLGPLALAVLAWLIVGKRHGEAIWLFATIAGGRLVVELLKQLFERARPPAADWLTTVTSHAFPSSHSAGSMLTALSLAMLFQPGRAWLFGPALAFACLVGWSRIALGVHWPSDVLAGLGFGLLWVGMASRWRGKAG